MEMVHFEWYTKKIFLAPLYQDQFGVSKSKFFNSTSSLHFFLLLSLFFFLFSFFQYVYRNMLQSLVSTLLIINSNLCHSEPHSSLITCPSLALYELPLIHLHHHPLSTPPHILVFYLFNVCLKYQQLEKTTSHLLPVHQPKVSICPIRHQGHHSWQDLEVQINDEPYASSLPIWGWG